MEDLTENNLEGTRSNENGYDILDFDGGNLRIEDIRNRVICGDALKVLMSFPDSSVDMVFIDPPYFLQLPARYLKRWKKMDDVAKVEDDWDKFGSFKEYDIFMSELLDQVRRVMKESATLWIISTYHALYRIGRMMQDKGFWFLNEVHWIKTNPMPNWLGVRFTNATETLIWATKGKDAKGYTFDRELAKEYGVGKVAANVWVFPICTGKERLKGDDGKRLHSTQKPVELLRRVISVSTKEGDLVLDPVGGVGTCAHVARELGRDFCTIDINPRYIEGARERLRDGVTFRKKGNIYPELEMND